MLDCALNIGNTIPVCWTDEVMQLTDPATKVEEFFVRIPLSDKEKAKSLFGICHEVKASGGPEDEFAFTTEPMTEAAFAEAAGRLTEIRSAIRILRG